MIPNLITYEQLEGEIIVKRTAELENVTEDLKRVDQMAWVRRMNNTRSRADEIV